MNGLKLVVASVVLGAIITLLTGEVNTLQLMGGSSYGLPATWLNYRVLSPVYNPWFVNWAGLVIDIVLWSVVVGLVLMALRRLNCGSSAPSRSRSRRSKK